MIEPTKCNCGAPPGVACAHLKAQARQEGEGTPDTARRAVDMLERHDRLGDLMRCSCTRLASTLSAHRAAAAEHAAVLILLEDVARNSARPRGARVDVKRVPEGMGCVSVLHEQPGKRPRSRKAYFVNYEHAGCLIRAVMDQGTLYVSDDTPKDTPGSVVWDFAQLPYEEKHKRRVGAE